MLNLLLASATPATFIAYNALPLKQKFTTGYHIWIDLTFAIFCAFAFAQEESSSSPDEGSSESPTKKPLLPALPPLLPPHGHGKPPGFMRGPIIIFNRSRDTPPKG